MKWEWQWFIAPGSALWVFPMVIAIATAMLVARQPWRPVLGWVLALTLAALLTAISKIAFYGWGSGVRAWDLTCFSGHTVLAFAGWPATLSLLAPPGYKKLRRLLIVIGVIFAALIGYSRVQLGAHPWSEVIAGSLLGGAVAFYAVRRLRQHHLPLPISAAMLAIALVASQLLSPGHYSKLLPTEHWFAQIGKSLSGQEKPVDRRQWRKAAQEAANSQR